MNTTDAKFLHIYYERVCALIADGFEILRQSESRQFLMTLMAHRNGSAISIYGYRESRIIRQYTNGRKVHEERVE